MLQFIYEYDTSNKQKYPLIIYHLLKILRLSGGSAFKGWYETTKATRPWIAHTLLAYTHNVIKSHVQLARNPALKQKYLRGEIQQEPITVLEPIISAFTNTKNSIEQVTNLGTGDYFWASPLTSWEHYDAWAKANNRLPNINNPTNTGRHSAQGQRAYN